MLIMHTVGVCIGLHKTQTVLACLSSTRDLHQLVPKKSAYITVKKAGVLLHTSRCIIILHSSSFHEGS